MLSLEFSAKAIPTKTIAPSLLAPERTPRRNRRGAGILEVTLGIFVTASVVAGVLEFIRKDQLDELNQASAREVSLVADAAEAFALINFDNVAALIANEDDDIAEVDPGVLQAAGFLDTNTPITAHKDPIAILYISDSPGVITAFAVARRTAGADNSYTIPRPEVGIRAVGINPRFRGGTVIGYGLEARIQNGQRSLVLDAGVSNGSLVGVRTVSFATDISPYLHRIAIPGRPELNQMETDLDMAGRSVTGVGQVQSAAVNSGSVEISNELAAQSAIIANGLTVNGSTTVIGALTGGEAKFSRRLDAATIDVSGEIRSSSMITQSLTAANASFTQSLTTDALTSTVLTTDALSTNNLAAANVTIQEITADTLILSGALTADEAFINQITTGSCTGC